MYSTNPQILYSVDRLLDHLPGWFLSISDAGVWLSSGPSPLSSFLGKTHLADKHTFKHAALRSYLTYFVSPSLIFHITSNKPQAGEKLQS